MSNNIMIATRMATAYATESSIVNVAWGATGHVTWNATRNVTWNAISRTLNNVK
jgi:hypothetical protein